MGFIKKTMKRLLPILTLILLSCSQTDKNESETEKSKGKSESHTDLPQEKKFEFFLKQFPKVELPLKIKGCEADFENLTELNEENTGGYVQDYSYAVGQIQTNGNYVAVITLGVADCLLPIITTYKPTGEKIDSKTIAIGYCGSGPCFECEEFMTLKKDYTLFTIDTMKIFDCDDDYNPIPGTESIEIIYKEGRLRVDGKIELSGEKKKKIK